ncbi:MAG: M20/M25/M40 family metallo-hydrolase [Polyangiaceae bacterium]
MEAHTSGSPGTTTWRRPKGTTGRLLRSRSHRGDRLYGRGIADNLGPLCLRLLALEQSADPAPALTFVLQGEEETGSATAHRLYPSLSLPQVDLWLEETGYFELDGTQRMLARRETELAASWIDAVIRAANAHGRAVVRHARHLNKAFGEHRCPFLTHLAGAAPYLAIGPNDPRSKIHGPDESLPVANLGVSVDQFRALLSAAATRG